MTGRQPKRIQRKRTRGWRMPAGAVYVGRPSRWGNLWQVGLANCGCRSWGECSCNTFRCETAADAVEAFRSWLTELQRLRPNRFEDYIAPLRGKDLACWCPLDQPCHADVLLTLSNATRGTRAGAQTGTPEA